MPFPTASPLRRLLVNSSTATSFPTAPQGATQTQPATVDSGTPTGNYGVVPSGGSDLLFIPFGSDADTETFAMRFIAWRKLTGAETTTPMYIPMHLGDVTVTLCPASGIASGLVTDLELFADTLALVSNGWGDIKLIQPGGDRPASIVIPSLGFDLVSVLFDLTGAASANALWGPIIR